MELGMNDKDQKPNVPSVANDKPIRLEDLGELISTKRRSERLTLEQASTQSGVSPATLSRLERQGQLRDDMLSSERLQYAPDTRTLARLTRWLGVGIGRV